MFVKINWQALEYDHKPEAILGWFNREVLEKETVFLIIDRDPYYFTKDTIFIKSDKGYVYAILAKYTKGFTPTENLESWL